MSTVIPDFNPSRVATPANPINFGTAPGTGGLAPIPAGSNASDTFKILVQQAQQRMGQVPTPVPYDPELEKLLKQFMANANTAEGLSPEAKAAMNAEATSGLPARYNAAASALRTQLLQRGMYGGALPANSGELLRDFGPLQSSMVDAQSAAGRQTILADEQAKIASLLSNRNLAMQAVGMGANMTNSTNSNNLAAFNAGTGAFGETLNAAANLGNLEQTSMKNLVVSSLLAAGTKALVTPGVVSGIVKSITGKGGAAGAGAGLAGSTAGIAAPAVSSIIGGSAGTAAGAGTSLSAILAGGVPEISSAAIGAGAPGSAALASVGVPGASGGGLTGALGALASNPATWVVAGAITAAIVWKKSQVHPTADKFVQSFQNPFGDHLGSMVNAFDKAFATGGMTKDQAIVARNEVAQFINEFEADRSNFAAKGKKEAEVAANAQQTMIKNFGQNYAAIIGKMDQEINGMAG